MIEKPTITVKDLIALGYAKGTAYSILRQAKAIMVERGFSFYENKRLGAVPTEVVEQIVGVELRKHGQN